MLRSRDFWYGVGATLVALYVYHHFGPGAGAMSPRRQAADDNG